jgi:WD40 repeat protein
VAYAPTGIVAAGGAGSSAREFIKFFDATGKDTRALKGGHGDFVTVLTYSPDGAILASGSRDTTIRLWDSASGTPIGTLSRPDRIFGVAFSPIENAIASASADGSVRIWSTSTGELLQVLPGHTDFVQCVAFSPNGSVLASGSRDRTIRLWNGKTRLLVGVIKTDRSVRSLAFSEDGTRLAAGVGEGTLDGAVMVWRVEDRGLIQTLSGGSLAAIDSVAFAPGQDQIAGACFDGTLRVWNVTAGGRANAIFVHEGEGFSRPARSVGYSADGKTLTVGTVMLDTKMASRSAIRSMSTTQKLWRSNRN